MRIGIITQPLTHNYGGILQNYALQQVLCTLGHRSITIDYLPRKHYGERFKHILWSIIHFRRPNTWWLPTPRQDIVKPFIHDHIETTYKVRKYRTSTIKLYRFKALIAGSDQIWRPMYNKALYDMYFDFSNSIHIKRIVYGASFGTDKWEYSEQQTEICQTLIRQADEVSVREKSGIELCRKHLKIDAQCVLDPTLLLEAYDYERLCVKIPRHAQPFIAVYLLDNNQILDRIGEISKSIDLPIHLFSAEEAMTLTVEEWVAMFRDAKYVITDSFHGTVFSIIFNKPFITIGNEFRGMDRFHSLLEQFGLEQRLSPTISIEILCRSIPWDDVNRRKQAMQNESVRFLKYALNDQST